MTDEKIINLLYTTV